MVDQLIRQAAAQFGLGDKGGDLAQMILQQVQKQGGLSRFLEGMGQSGLKDKADSWVGTGENAPISAEEAGSALGPGFLQEAAAKLGVSPEAVGGATSHILPEMVNQATPEGRVPEGLDLGSLAQQFLGGQGGGIGGMLSGLLGGDKKP